MFSVGFAQQQATVYGGNLSNKKPSRCSTEGIVNHAAKEALFGAAGGATTVGIAALFGPPGWTAAAITIGGGAAGGVLTSARQSVSSCKHKKNR